MAKPIIFAAMLTIALTPAAWSQPAPPAGQPAPPALLRGDHITATGETVPLPGRSQSEGTTSLDRNIQRKDRAIENSICKGC